MRDSIDDKLISRLEETSPLVQGIEQPARDVFLAMLRVNLLMMPKIGKENLYAKLLNWRPGDEQEPLTEEELGLDIYTASPSPFAFAASAAASQARGQNMWGWPKLALLSSVSFVLGCLSVLGLQYVTGL